MLRARVNDGCRVAEFKVGEIRKNAVSEAAASRLCIFAEGGERVYPRLT
jgi:hypothetical protein